MKKIKTSLRFLLLLILLTLAAFGVGLIGFHNHRYQDKTNQIEIVEKKNEENNEEEDQQ